MQNFDSFFQNLSLKGFKPSKGNLLIAEPFLNDYYFGRSVIYLVEHDENGSLGFILNKPTQSTVSDLVPELPNCKFHVYLGGPVQTTNLYYIHSKGSLIENSIKIQQGIYWGGDFDQIKEMIEANLILKNEIRFFLGYSGWSNGQLDQEMEQESWLVNQNPGIDLILKPHQGNKFWIKLTKQMGKYSVLANFPVDPNYN